MVRRDLLANRVPAVPGGGTVTYVSGDQQLYLADPEHREEGGTPAIVESIRAGLVFSLKEQVGTDLIRKLEHEWITRAIASWSANPNLRILGNPEADRLSIVSFLVRAPSHLGENRFLHHNFVVAVLNDLFGIQARGGCSCAGPYGHRLLGIDADTSDRIRTEVLAGCNVIKPGWVRVNFNYFIPEEEYEYVERAVHLVADKGWRLLPLYEYDSETSEWFHRDGQPVPPLSLAGFLDESPRQRMTAPLERLADFLAEAEEILDRPIDPADPCAELSPGSEALRWFPLPHEVQSSA